jgi:hypothetical protein
LATVIERIPSANMNPSNSSSTGVNYEILPDGMAMDETDVNLRSYFSRMSDEKLAEYVATWTDDKLMDWDKDSWRDDGTLFLTCSERDVEIEEYRRVLVEHIRFRFADKRKK